MDRIQEQQILYTSKMEKERKRTEELDELLEGARQQRRVLRDLTRNGSIVNEDDKTNRTNITKLEKKLQSAKIKLSVCRRDNSTQKMKIDKLRKDKLMHLQIKVDMVSSFVSRKFNQSLCHMKTILLYFYF